MYSEEKLSLNELKQRNAPPPQPPQVQKPPTHPTQDEWNQLLDLLCGLYDLQAEQLRWEKHQPILYAAQEQMRELIREVGRLRMEIEQAGKQNEKRLSLPRIHLPEFRFRPWWLVLLPILVALWAMWSSLDTIWNTFSLLLS